MKNLIKRANQILTAVRLSLGEGDLESALDLLHMADNSLSQANETKLARKVGEIIELLRNRNVNNALVELRELTAAVNELLVEEQRTVRKKETPHIHLVSELPCPKCNKNIPKDAKFCPYCGKPIQRRLCPNCKKVVEVGWKFCRHCGTSLQ